MPGATRGDGAGRRFTNQNEIDGALVRHPPEVVLLAHGTGGPDRQARPAARVARRPTTGHDVPGIDLTSAYGALGVLVGLRPGHTGLLTGVVAVPAPSCLR